MYGDESMLALLASEVFNVSGPCAMESTAVGKSFDGACPRGIISVAKIFSTRFNA